MSGRRGSRRRRWLRAALLPLVIGASSAAALRLGAQDAPAAPLRLGLVADVAARVGPSVVRVELTGGRARGDLPRRHLFRPVAERDGGSGIVVGPDLVVTHGALADAVAPSFTIITASGERRAATLLHLDARREVAVLRTAERLAAPAATLLPLDAPAPRTGALVLALGDPFGTARDATATVSLGNIEGRARLDAAEVAWDGEVLLTTAAINPGSEGGALVDLEGRVVGLLAPLARDRRSGALHGHALPAEVVLAVLAAATGGPAPKLGLAARSSPDGRGLLVERVTPGGAAERAGVRAGDLLLRAGDAALGSNEALRAALAAARGVTVRLVLERGGAELTLELSPDAGGGR